MVLRIDDRDMAAVCVTSGSAGGQIRCQEQLPIGARLALTARASGTTLAEVCLVACVASSTVDRARGSATLEVDWLSATSAGGARVLHSFLTSKVQLAVEIAAISSIGGFAVYRFAVMQSGKGPPLRGDSEVLRARHMARVISIGGASAPGAIQVHLPPRLVAEGTKAPASEDTEPASPRALWRMGHSAPWPDHVPETMANRYTGLRFLGSGGYGVVYEAWDDLLDRPVALKFIQPGLDGEEFGRQFLREVRITVGLAHPHIIRIYDAGKANDTLYFAMESIAGRTLCDYLRPGGLDLPFVVRVVCQLANALDYIHSRGIYHFDVKPDNVLVERSGSVQLFDFGLARSRSNRPNERSVVLGTPQYMAPEQPSIKELDGRCDQYSLAVMAYELLTGRLPFTEGNLFVAHALQPVPDPRMFRPELPATTVAVLVRGMAKRPGERFGTCTNFGRALELSLAKAGPVAPESL